MKVIFSSIALLMMSSFTSAEAKLGTKEILLDNEQVEVVRAIYPAGTESGMHTHKYPNRVAYFVKGGTVELVPSDATKRSNIMTVADGKVLFLPGVTHNVKNIGDTEVVIIETELK